MKKYKNIKAVTLTELLTVIMIMGIIIAFGIPQYVNVIKNARQKTAKTCLGLIKDAQSTYFDDNGIYYKGTSTTIVTINTALNLAITGDFLSYTCIAPTDSSNLNGFACRATYPNTGAAQWCCDVTNLTTNPACSNAPCPTL